MTATIYLHSNRESNRKVGEDLGLDDSALGSFMYTCYEVKIDLDVDPETGYSTIVAVNDRAVAA